MKSIGIFILCAGCLCHVQAGASGIFGNGTSSEDTVSVSVHVTDSLGNPSGTHADSFFVCVIGPSGDSIFTMAGAASAAGLQIDSLNTAMAGWRYIYTGAIADIDGSGRPGIYELTFCAKDNQPRYVNCVRMPFQVVGTDLSARLANIAAILDTLRNQDDWVSSFDPAADTVPVDLVKISGDKSAADDFETMLDGTGGKKLSIAGLHIRAASNDTAVIVAADQNGSGLGVSIRGGNGGEGIKIVGGDGKSALVAQAGATAGAGHGFDLIGAGEGVGLNGSLALTTRQAIADGVWDETQSGHTTSGTFGYYLDAPVSSIEGQGGQGSYPVTVQTHDSITGLAVPGVKVSIHNLQITALMALGLTDNDGRVVFNLDSDNYVMSAVAPGYIFAAYDTLAVSGATTDTIDGYRFDPGSPSEPGLCRVYGFIYGIDGLPMKDIQVTAELPEGVVRYNSIIVSPFKRTAVSDSLGYFYLDLIPSATMQPDGAKYLISAAYPSGTILKRHVHIPDSSTWLFSW